MGTALCFRFLRFPKALKHSGRKCSEQMTVCCLGLKLARPMFSTHSFSSSGRLNGNLRGRGGGAKQEASERSSALLSVLGLHATPPHTPHAPGQRGTSGNLALLGHIQFPEGSVVAVPGILSRKLKTMIMFPKLCLPGELSLVPSGAAGGPALGALLGVLLWVLQSGSKIPSLMEPTV